MKPGEREPFTTLTATYVVLPVDELPRGARGKADYRAVLALVEARRADSSPRSDRSLVSPQ